MNKCFMIGRLTKDPEVRYSAKNNAIASFSLAVDRKYKEGDTLTDFFRCVAFGKLGEFVEKYLKKGIKVVVTGRIENDSYTNKDGQKVNTTQIICEEIEFAESKKTDQEQDRPKAPDDSFIGIPENIEGELPFK